MTMTSSNGLDCIVIGYNETNFEEYERLLRGYGEDSEAYRDLKFSFVNLEGKKMNYVGLLNHMFALADDDNGASNSEEKFKSCDIPNLAAVYLTHYLKKGGFEARHINLFQYDKEKLVEYLSSAPLCVAITTTFYVINLPVNELVEFIRRHNDTVKIIVGGPLIANHVRNCQGDDLAAALLDMGADFYVYDSQGELTLTSIVECLKSGGNLSNVPNIYYFEDGKLRKTPPLPEANSLDEWFIDWRAFSEERLGPTLQTRTARSCAFNCSFCNYPTRAGKLTLANLHTVEKELDSMRDLGYVKNVVFIDDTFNVPLPRFKDICRLMIEKDYRFNWFSYFRCSNSDEEAIDLMARSGCKGVFLGIESGSPTILQNMNKAATVEKYVTGIDRLKQYGVLTFASFIMGFPGETEETVEETMNFIRETRPDYYRAQLWYCEPGTPIDRRRQEYGVEGEGFVWSHNTMDSLEAIEHIERLFLTIDESYWLPQWSFDFWTIPYLMGNGLTAERFKELMAWAHRLLRLEIAYIPPHQKKRMQQEYVQATVDAIRNWRQPGL